jgi:hypothetical protein
LILALILFQGSVHAGWQAAERSHLSPDLQTDHVDQTTIRREDNLVTLCSIGNRLQWK